MRSARNATEERRRFWMKPPSTEEASTFLDEAHVQPISQAVETKRVLLNEALDLDDFNDRMASVLNDIDT